MSSEPDEPKKDGPPPPSIKPPSTPPPAPSMSAGPPAGSVPPMNVRVKEGSEEDELPVEEEDTTQVPFGTRIVAALIDFAIVAGLQIGVAIIASLPFLGFLSLLAWPLSVVFLLFRDSLPFLKGQSPGKTAMKLKVVTTGGEGLVGNLQPALIRNAVLLIPIFALVELIVLLTREDKPDQGVRLGDEWAGTRVVRADLPEEEADAPDDGSDGAE